MNNKKFTKYAWFVVAFTVLVILWGAVVRATGSGAGCGSHWPLCNGEMLPDLEKAETTIELIHRITSSLAGLLVVGLVIFALRVQGRKSTVTKWAIAALVFIIIEGLLGRMLVVREWVTNDASAMRALVVAVHLANTYILLGTMVVTARLSGKREELRLRGDRLVFWFVVFGLIVSTLLSALGAVTALGDTLFPPNSVSTNFRQYLDPTVNFLIRLRIIHPVMAILTSGYLYFMVRFFNARGLGPRVEKRGRILVIVIGLQILAGGFTILTLAPLFMQILHLLLADLFWITLVIFSLESITTPLKKS